MTMTAQKKPDLTESFATALGCTPKFIQTRLIALGHGEACHRCGGGGHYSYCAMYGTTCFGCSGSGKAVRNLTPTLLETVKVQVAAGELAPYLERIKATSTRKAKVRGFMDRFFAVWGANPTVAADKGLHFTKCSERHHQINAFCAPMCDEASKLVRLVEDGEWSKERRGYVPVSDERQTEAVARLQEIMQAVSQAETLAPESR